MSHVHNFKWNIVQKTQCKLQSLFDYQTAHKPRSRPW